MSNYILKYIVRGKKEVSKFLPNFGDNGKYLDSESIEASECYFSATYFMLAINKKDYRISLTCKSIYN